MKRQLLALQKLPELLRRFNRFEKFVKTRIPQETGGQAPKKPEKQAPPTESAKAATAEKTE